MRSFLRAESFCVIATVVLCFLHLSSLKLGISFQDLTEPDNHDDAMQQFCRKQTSVSWTHASNSDVFPIPNVLLLGQFNFNPSRVETIQDWVSIWSRYFSNIMVVGPFSNGTITGLNKLRIAYRVGAGDAGMISPYRNLGDVASALFHCNSTIEAVLYLHDDMLLNLTYFLSLNGGKFPTDRMLWNRNEITDRRPYYINVVQEFWRNGTVRNFTRENGNEFTDAVFAFRKAYAHDRWENDMTPHNYPWDGNLLPYQAQFSQINGACSAVTPAEFLSPCDARFKRWPWQEWCIMQLLSMLIQGPRAILDDYAIRIRKVNEIESSLTRISRNFSIYWGMQSDFFLLPTKWADEFGRLAKVFADHDVFIETALPTIAKWLMIRNQKMIQENQIQNEMAMRAQIIPLCTFPGKGRGGNDMIEQCFKNRKKVEWGNIHPLKLELIGTHKWEKWLNRTQFPSNASPEETVPEEQIPVAATRSNNSGVFPIPNVLLLGQFNYPTGTETVQDWVSIWSKYFSNIMVTGPFSNDTVMGLNRSGIAYRVGAGDAGMISPYRNLGDAALEMFHNNSAIEAVLYLHDDMLLNLTYFLSINEGTFPTDRFLWNYNSNGYYYINMVQENWRNGTVRNFTRENGNEFSDSVYDVQAYAHGRWQKDTTAHDYPWHGNVLPYQAQFSTIGGKFLSYTPAEFLASSKLSGWVWQEWTIMQLLSMIVQEPRSVLDDYATRIVEDTESSLTRVERNFSVYWGMQSDFFLLPTKWANEFGRLAKVFADHDVFLETALPTIVKWLLIHDQNMIQEKQIPKEMVMRVQNIPLCSCWDIGRNGNGTLNQCIVNNHVTELGNIHPLKLGLISSQNWGKWLEITQLPYGSRQEKIKKYGLQT